MHAAQWDLMRPLTVQPELFSGAVLLAPMLSLERVSKKGLNPYLRCAHAAALPSAWCNIGSTVSA